MKQLSYLLLIVAVIAVQSCKKGEEKQTEPQKTTVSTANESRVLPPFENVDVPFKTFTIDASKEQTIRTETGTVINIPEGAFQDADGNKIEGEVDIQYREFHNAAGIITSGIPMTNTEGDEYMETAGMFEIRGSQNGQDIQIEDGKALEVKMASFVAGDDYDYFYFDENSNNWETIESGTIEKNKAKSEMTAQAPKLPEAPVEPKKYDDDVFTFNLNIDYSSYPELVVYNDILWQYYEQGEGADPAMNPEKNKWSFAEDWTEIELEPSEKELGKYYLFLKNNQKQFKTVITPTLEGENYEEAMAAFEKKNKEYLRLKAEKEQRLKEIEEMKERQKNEADFLRSFRISTLGIYNCDAWRSATFVFDADFDYGQESFNSVDIFQIIGDNRSVVRRYRVNEDRFFINPDQDNCFIAILPGNRIAYFSKEDFKKIDIFKLKQYRKYTFDMTILDEQIESFDDFDLIFDKINN